MIPLQGKTENKLFKLYTVKKRCRTKSPGLQAALNMSFPPSRELLWLLKYNFMDRLKRRHSKFFGWFPEIGNNAYGLHACKIDII